LGLAVALLVFVTLAGTAGYIVVEGWSAWDAFYMSVITITTVGYREVHPMSRAGEALTIVLLTAGVGAALYTFTLLATIVVEGGLPDRLQQRRLQRMLENISDHFIICGYGRIGSTVAHQFQRQRVSYVVIERDPERLHQAIDDGAIAVEADASREEVLKRVGIDRARGLIAAVGTDAENVYTVLTARVMRPDLFIIARVESDDAEHKLKRAGADRVISPYQIGATHMAQSALRPAVVDFVQLATSSAHLDLSMEQVHIDEGSPLIGLTLLESGIRQKFGVIVIAIKRADGAMEFNPPSEAMVRAGDEMVVLGQPQSVKALEDTVTL
jgi:voltage-gated potassium channel